MQILPIASGKGGVGKSLLAANTAISLSEAGKKVILVDLDLGASNLHILLGLSGIKTGIGTFLNDPDIDLSDIIVDAGYKGLQFIPGDAEIPGIANLQAGQKRSLLRKLLALDADFLILDLGAGTSFNTLDFFLSSGQGIIVTAPTLTATLNAYLFLKNALFRILTTMFKKDSPARELLDHIKKDTSVLQKLYIPKLLEQIKDADPEGFEEYQKRISKFHPRLVLNMLEDPKDAQKAGKIRRSCKEYLDLDIEHLGIIYRDHLQDVALSSRLPIVRYKPQSVLSQAIYRISDKLLQSHDEGAAPLDIQTLDESYQVAEMEAEIDFDSKLHEIENLLHSGALTMGDMMETVKSQQFEITRLKKENQLIKNRLVKAINSGFRV